MTQRAAKKTTASINGSSVSSATLTPTVGTNHITLTVPNTKPAPKTIAKYTADDVNSFMDVFESRIAA